MIKTVFKILFYIVATFYVTDTSFKLMTYPNDLSFVAGMLLLLLVSAFWVDTLYVVVNKFLKESSGEKGSS